MVSPAAVFRPWCPARADRESPRMAGIPNGSVSLALTATHAAHPRWRCGTGLLEILLPEGDLRHHLKLRQPIDFVSGFLTEDGRTRGRPVGVTVAPDGAVIIADDLSNIVWRVTPDEANTQQATEEAESAATEEESTTSGDESATSEDEADTASDEYTTSA